MENVKLTSIGLKNGLSRFFLATTNDRYVKHCSHSKKSQTSVTHSVKGIVNGYKTVYLKRTEAILYLFLISVIPLKSDRPRCKANVFSILIKEAK